MLLSKRHAELVISNLREFIEEDINYILPDGTILASSNEERVGKNHPAGIIVSKTNSTLIIEDDNQYEGARQGVNFPIFHDNKLVAIVGITGDHDKSTRFAKIVVKVTEILIKEHTLNEQLSLEKERNKMFLDLLSNEELSTEALVKKSSKLGIDINKFNYMVLLKVKDHETLLNYSNQIHSTIAEKMIEDDIVVYSDRFFLIISTLKSQDAIKSYLKEIQSRVEERYKVLTVSLVSDKLNEDTRKSNIYKSLKSLAKSKSFASKAGVIIADMSAIEIIVQNLPKNVKEEFYTQVLSNFKVDELNDIWEMIYNYVKFNGSINKTSDALFLHKNTLQYRLDRIYKLSGHNPRDLEGIIKLYLALLINEQN